jgi:poly-beta-1,6-N-acetyl-D-glucosamine synthase
MRRCLSEVMSSMIIELLYLFSFLLIWQFVGYPTLMMTITYLSRPPKKDYTYEPFISILIATYNEESVIANRLHNLFELDYPTDKYEILVVNSGSTDNTAPIVQSFIDNPKFAQLSIKLIEENKRNGKSSAINLGQKHARGDIVLITDANSFCDKSVLRELMPHFKDPHVGAVSGKYIVSNSCMAIPASEAFYWEIESIMFLGESCIDSISTVTGTISAWRKHLMNFNQKTLSEDLDMTIQVRSKGYKIKYEPQALVYEPSAVTAVDQIKQRKRTCIGTIQNFFLHIRYFLTSPNLFTCVIFPSHKMLAILSPFFILSVLSLYIFSWDLNVIIFHLIISTIAFSLVFMIMIFLKSRLIQKGKNSSKLSTLSIPKIICYVLLNEYLILLAWLDFISKNYSVLWERAESTRRVIYNKEF